MGWLDSLTVRDLFTREVALILDVMEHPRNLRCKTPQN